MMRLHMYTPEQVFKQALRDDFAANLDGDGYEARLVYGTKICRDNATGKVEFFNVTHKGGSWGGYLPLTEGEVFNFLHKGWRYGVYVLYLSNNRLKLDKIERRIRREANADNNLKVISYLTAQRQKVLEGYNKINHQLNLISNGTD